MNLFEIRFQTSELIPPPYAHAIEILAHNDPKGGFSYIFEISYLDRESLTEDEILEEGFSLNDDLQLKGTLPLAWKSAYDALLEKTKKTYPTEIEDKEDFWEILTVDEPFYPKNTREWKIFLEEIRQAITEQNKLELPLSFQIKRIDQELTEDFLVEGKFEERVFQITKKDGETKELEWIKLNNFLKDIFSGEFVYEKTSTKMPKRTGLFLNLGDEIWYEVGKSLLTQPSKITKWLAY